MIKVNCVLVSLWLEPCDAIDIASNYFESSLQVCHNDINRSMSSRGYEAIHPYPKYGVKCIPNIVINTRVALAWYQVTML